MTGDQARLVRFYLRNGCVRAPRADRLPDGHETYKKGWEIRLMLESRQELAEIRRLLAATGLPKRRPYKKRKQWVQPIYGLEAVKRFAEWISRA